MKLSQLLQEIGDDNIQYNLLPELIVDDDIVNKKGRVEVKIGIPEIKISDLFAHSPEKVVMLLVLPGPKIRALYARRKAIRELAMREGAEVICPTCDHPSTADKDGLSACCKSRVWHDDTYPKDLSNLESLESEPKQLNFPFIS